jgi:hypothetical protein
MAAFEEDKDTAFAAEIKARVHIMRYKCEDIQARIGVMRETSQAMTQMVRYNHLHYYYPPFHYSSSDIQIYAILQQRDNEVSHRYAANVNIITAITLIFLPGTFIATLFSASFWNFDPRGEGPLVSKWIWLYCLVTVALTLIVLGIWRGYTVLKQVVGTVKGVWRKQNGDGWLRRRARGDEEQGEKDE